MAAAVLAVLVGSGGLAQVRSQSERPKEAKASTHRGDVSGRVTSTQTGAPLRRVMVRAMPAFEGVPAIRSTTTDGEGKFRLADLPVGKYRIVASKAGFVTASFGQKLLDDLPRFVDVERGRVSDGVDIALGIGGAINGHVADEFGEPIAGVSVQAKRIASAGGERRLLPVGSGAVITDDLGGYRIYGLRPGEYVVEANPGASLRLETTDSAPVSTFYPGTADLGSAAHIQLQTAENATGIDFSLSTSKLSAISGRVVDSAGRSLDGARVFLTHEMQSTLFGRSALRISSIGATTDRAGAFSIKNLTEGIYSLDATHGPSREFGSIRLAVAGDRSDVVVATTPGARISGAVSFLDGLPISTPPVTCRVIDLPIGDTRSTPASAVVRSSVGPDWSFDLQGVLDGQRTFRLHGCGDPLLVDSVFVGTQEVTDTGVRIAGGKGLTDVELRVTRLPAGLVGFVSGRDGERVSSCVVAVFSAEPQNWRAPDSRFVAAVRAGTDGDFVVEGLPPGEYVVAAVQTMPEGAIRDPGFLATFQGKGVRVQLLAGQLQPVEVRLSK